MRAVRAAGMQPLGSSPCNRCFLHALNTRLPFGNCKSSMKYRREVGCVCSLRPRVAGASDVADQNLLRAIGGGWGGGGGGMEDRGDGRGRGRRGEGKRGDGCFLHQIMGIVNLAPSLAICMSPGSRQIRPDPARHPGSPPRFSRWVSLVAEVKRGGAKRCDKGAG